MEYVSNCCGATFLAETDVCSSCLEHAEAEVVADDIDAIFANQNYEWSK